MRDDETKRAMLRVAGASRVTGMSIPWLNSARRLGKGPAFVKIGRAVRYRRADLEAWLAASTVRPTGEVAHV